MDLVEIGDARRASRRHRRSRRSEQYRRPCCRRSRTPRSWDGSGAMDAQQFVEMGGIVMSEDKALGARTADTFDHRIVVERVREDRTVRQELAQCAECGEVRDPSRCEDQRRPPCREGRRVRLRARHAAGWSRRCCAYLPFRRLTGRWRVHGGQHIRMLAHAEVVIAAPDGDATAPTIAARATRRSETPRPSARSSTKVR